MYHTAGEKESMGQVSDGQGILRPGGDARPYVRRGVNSIISGHLYRIWK